MKCEFVGVVFLLVLALPITSSEFNVSIIDKTFSQWFNDSVNDTLEYIIEYHPLNLRQARVTVLSEDATVEAPLLVMVRQHKEIVSWQVPLSVQSDQGKIPFNKTARMLCPSNDLPKSNDLYTWRDVGESPFVSLSTASKDNISFSLVVEHIDVYIESSVEYAIVVSPSEPRYYYYEFPTNNETNGSNYQTVLLEVHSEDDICTTVSIQNASCPVFDLNSDVTFEGYWETVLHQGGITIPKRKFPHGFFVVFVPKGDDSDCFGESGIVAKDREKHLKFIIKPSISYDDYVNAVAITIICIILLYVFFITVFMVCSRRGFKPRAMEYVEESFIRTENEVTTPSSVGDPDFLNDNISFDETEYDTIAEVSYDRELILSKPVLYLSDLARKDPRILKKKSYLYLWHVLTVALFYGLPVIQLVITYQKVLNDTGNQDLCYYNFLCAHPFGFLSDFNHVFSNIGYITFGLLFLWFVRRRERLHNDITFDKHYGIPQHYGLFYAMGVALFMEGVLSGSYHICPNHSNFQFDSSFMYVMAVLSMVKIYQTRHPDINATAYATFGVLAIAILLGMIGILEATIYFWVAFTVLHLTLCLLLTAQIYYFGYWRLDRGVCRRIWNGLVHDYNSGLLNVLKPNYTGRMVLMVLGNACNWALAIVGLLHHKKDFATYLLGVFMCNTLLYFTFYVIMKLVHREKINNQALAYLVLALTCACTAMYCFYHKSISWDLTPALSRQYNQECKVLDFYDFHDVWHFLSAVGMFFTFMLLLTLDDDLSHTSRTKISVF